MRHYLSDIKEPEPEKPKLNNLLIIDGSLLFLHSFNRDGQMAGKYGFDYNNMGSYTKSLDRIEKWIKLFDANKVIIVFDNIENIINIKLNNNYKIYNIIENIYGERPRFIRRPIISNWKGFNNMEDQHYYMKKQYKVLINCLKSLPIHVIINKSNKVNEIIKYLCKSYDCKIVIATLDEEILQLITNNIKVFKYNRFQIIDKAEVFRIYKCSPNNLPLVNSILGNPRKGIPIIENVGLSLFTFIYPFFYRDDKIEIKHFYEVINRLHPNSDKIHILNKYKKNIEKYMILNTLNDFKNEKEIDNILKQELIFDLLSFLTIKVKHLNRNCSLKRCIELNYYKLHKLYHNIVK